MYLLADNINEKEESNLWLRSKNICIFCRNFMRTMRKLAVIVHNIEKGEWDLVILKKHDVAKGWQY